MSKPKYDHTLARMAGNIAAGLCSEHDNAGAAWIASEALRIAKDIVGRLKVEQLHQEALDGNKG